MTKRWLSIIQYIIFLGAGIFLVWWQLKSMSETGKQEFYQALSRANYSLILPIAVMILASHLSRAMRWKLLMEPLGYKPALKNVFAVTLVGYLVNAAIPRLGEVVKCSLLARYEKLKVDKLVGTVIIERTFDLVCYIIFIGITVLLQVNVIGGEVRKRLRAIGEAPGFPLWAKLLLAATVIVGVLLLVKYLFRKYPQNTVIAKVNSFLKGILEGFRTIRRLQHRRAFILHTIFIWSMYLLQIYVAFSAMEGTAHLDIKAAFSVLTLATLAMIATPNGIGTFPIFVKETLIIYGISGSLGQAFGSLIWGVSTAFLIVAGLVALLLLPYINRKKHEVHTINS